VIHPHHSVWLALAAIALGPAAGGARDEDAVDGRTSCPVNHILFESVAAASGDYEVRLIAPQKKDGEAFRGPVVEVAKDDRLVLRFKVHRSTPFCVHNDRLTYVDYVPIRPGGEIVHVSLVDGRQLWRSRLEPPSVTSTSIGYLGYVTDFRLAVNDSAVTVFCHEHPGTYVEVKSLEDGTTISNETSPRPPATVRHERAARVRMIWHDTTYVLFDGAVQASGDYEIRIVAPQKKDGELPRDFVVELVKDDRRVLRFMAHGKTPIALRDDRLTYVDFDPAKPGGHVVHASLKEGRELWRSPLESVVFKGNSDGYVTRYRIDVGTEHVTIYGNESHGKYIEMKSLDDGRTISSELESRVRTAR
jgi:hypothetical protein